MTLAEAMTIITEGCAADERLTFSLSTHPEGAMRATMSYWGGADQYGWTHYCVHILADDAIITLATELSERGVL